VPNVRMACPKAMSSPTTHRPGGRRARADCAPLDRSTSPIGHQEDRREDVREQTRTGAVLARVPLVTCKQDSERGRKSKLSDGGQFRAAAHPQGAEVIPPAAQ
jgi:hypothetical protein